MMFFGFTNCGYICPTTLSELKKMYNDPTLVKSPTQLLSKVKNNLGPDLAGKIDSWQFSLSTDWPILNDETANQLIGEKISHLATKHYETKKEDMARDIKRAQESGDIETIKKLMNSLNELTRGKAGE